MTTDTPTPRTKGMTGTFYLRCDDCPQPHKCESHKCVHPDDCADIERDLSECRAALAELVAAEDANDLLPGYAQRRRAAWSTARELATKNKEPQPAAKEL